ncbi:hypothetical protein AVEN_68436-1 [Araneus ventricosus]|uniref:Uncharacterized protein n=1 Tax=Araneus ventricosus TaxID=182803 RepID=A0A4Y2JQ09_ARAVE|nr:hypothetical protein AVEN_68436-1 [Araneus ventricosus]
MTRTTPEPTIPYPNFRTIPGLECLTNAVRFNVQQAHIDGGRVSNMAPSSPEATMVFPTTLSVAPSICFPLYSLISLFIVDHSPLPSTSLPTIPSR